MINIIIDLGLETNDLRPALGCLNTGILFQVTADCFVNREWELLKHRAVDELHKYRKVGLNKF